MTLLLATAAALALGSGDYLAAIATRIDGRPGIALPNSLLFSLLGAVAAWLALPLLPPDRLTAGDAALALSAGVVIAVARPIVMKAMADGAISVVAPVIGLTALAVPVVIGPLLGDQLSASEVIGVALAFPAVFLVAYSGETGRGRMATGQSVAIAVGAGALLGSAAILFGATGTDTGLGAVALAQLAATLVLVVVTWSRGLVVLPAPRARSRILGAAALNASAVIMSVTALQRGPVAVVAAVLALAPAPAIYLAWLLDQERILRNQALGAVIGIGIVVLFAVG